jgi:hypothetical protein
MTTNRNALLYVAGLLLACMLLARESDIWVCLCAGWLAWHQSCGLLNLIRFRLRARKFLTNRQTCSKCSRLDNLDTKGKTDEHAT